MAVDERRRAELFDGLAATLGQEAAATMFELLPSPNRDLATREDVDRLEGRFAAIDLRFDQVEARFADMDRRFEAIDERFAAIDERFAEMDQRFTEMDQRFTEIEHRFELVDQRFDFLEARIDDRIDGLRTELLAAFRGGLVTAVAGQTRALIVSAATATFGIGGLAVTLSQLL